MKRIAAVLAVVGMFGVSGRANATLLSTAPSQTGYAYDGYPGVPQLGIPANPYDGVYDKLFIDGLLIITRTVSNGSTLFETRAAIEYPLTGIPANAAISSAAFNYTESDDANNGVQVVGYSGDGTVNFADMTRSGTLLSGSLTNGVREFGNQTLDVTSHVQSLYASNASHLGLLLVPTVGTPQGSFTQYIRGTLQVTYVVPEPATLGAIGVALPMLRRRRPLRVSHL